MEFQISFPELWRDVSEKVNDSQRRIQGRTIGIIIELT